MNILFSKSNQILKIGELSFPAWSKVRNELNGQRRPEEVVLTEPDPHPYYPRRFPVGKWNVFMPVERTSTYLAPYFIPTNAWQDVEIWSLKNGGYHRNTSALYRDSGYGLHYSSSSTTLGCIRIGELKDLLWLVDKIKDERGPVTLEVIE